MWANLYLLFWLSLIPFVTAWLGENHYAQWPVALYGVVLLMAGTAYYILQAMIIRSQGPDSLLKKAVGSDFKGKASPVFYLAAILFTFFAPWVAEAIYAGVVLMWIIPDRRIERMIRD